MPVKTIIKGEVTRGRNGKLRYHSRFIVTPEKPKAGERLPRLNPVEERVLAKLATGSDDLGYFNFRQIQSSTHDKRPEVRRACRSLARKGLAKFGKGLWTDEGEPFGSGYSATLIGKARADAKLVRRYE